MGKLNTRSYEPELLDGDNIPFEDIRMNMAELNTVNSLLGGHAITLTGIRSLLPKVPRGKTIHIAEIGCGGGDNLQAIYAWGLKAGLRLRFTGIDIKETCTLYARKQYPSLPAQWICSDYKLVDFGGDKPDILFNSLFCHHFDENGIHDILRWMSLNSIHGFFINDLQRNALAYQLIKLITKIFSNSYLVKHDAPLSVARGFHQTEWETLLARAGIRDYTIQWKWAFRYLIICRHE